MYLYVFLADMHIMAGPGRIPDDFEMKIGLNLVTTSHIISLPLWK
jgi:hypothetical protein